MNPSIQDSIEPSRDGIQNQISFLIVTYNNRQTIRACLDSLPQGCPVYVLDNASRDGTAAFVRDHYPNVSVFEQTQNIGFGNGHNMMFRQVQTPYACLVNPDAAFIGNSVACLLESMRLSPKAAVLAPLHVGVGGRVEPCFQPFEEQLDQPKTVHMVSGAVMLLRMACFDGYFFDKNIFLYYEDDDMCETLRRKGWEIIVDPRARYHHNNSHSTRGSLKGFWFKGYHMGWSFGYFQNKHFSAFAEQAIAQHLRKKKRHFVFRLLQGDLRNALLCCGIVMGLGDYRNKKVAQALRL